MIDADHKIKHIINLLNDLTSWVFLLILLLKFIVSYLLFYTQLDVIIISEASLTI